MGKATRGKMREKKNVSTLHLVPMGRERYRESFHIAGSLMGLENGVALSSGPW